jgi:pyrimidine 5'-nucleotidase
MSELTLFIDLDDTLYPADCGVWQDIRGRIDLYMQTVLGIPQDEVPELRHYLFSTYGTTLRGLEATMAVDAMDYLRFVHDVPLDHYLSRDDKLRQILASYPMPKYILTNGDQHHAQRVLKVLGLEGIFEDIIDILALSPYCKPMPQAFDIALERAHQPNTTNCVLVDDSALNLIAAHEMGFQTVLVGPPNPTVPFARSIRRLADLPEAIPLNGKQP